MKEILTVIKKTQKNKYQVKDFSGVQKSINTEKEIKPNDSILVINNIVIGIVQKDEPEIYNV